MTDDFKGARDMSTPPAVRRDTGRRDLGQLAPDTGGDAAGETLLTQTLARAYRGYSLVALCEVALPVFLLRLNVEVMERRDLSTMATYVAGAVRLGVDRPAQLALLLGMDARAIATGAAELLQRGLARQLDTQHDALGPGVSPPLALTPAGTAALGHKSLPAPRRVSLRLFYNALTGELDAVDETAWPPDVLLREGLPALPSARDEWPTLGDLDQEAVNRARKRAYPKADSELTQLLELRRPRPLFLARHTVALLRYARGGEERVVVSRRGVTLPAETVALQRLFIAGQWRMPEDSQEMGAAAPLRVADRPVVQADAGAPGGAAEDAARLERLEDVAARLRGELTAAELAAAQDGAEADLRAEVTRLADQVRSIEGENTRLRAQLGQRKIHFLAMEEHRPLLERALREVRVECLIISPWLRREACDDALCQLIADAVKRGVRVRIGHGIQDAQRPAYTLNQRQREDRDRDELNTETVIKALYRALPAGTEAGLEVRRAPRPTHEKLLVVDPEVGGFACVTSFNFLSFRGFPGGDARREMGSLFEDAVEVGQVARLAREALGDGVQRA